MSQQKTPVAPIHQKSRRSAATVLTAIVKSLVNSPEYVSVHTDLRDEGVVLILEVKAEDIEYVTGRNCRTVTSLRTIVSALSAQTDRAISLDIRAARV